MVSDGLHLQGGVHLLQLEPTFEVEAVTVRAPLSRRQLLVRSAVGGLVAGAAALLTVALASGLRSLRGGSGLDLWSEVRDVVLPGRLADATTVAGLLVELRAAATKADGLIAGVPEGPAVPTGS